MNILLRGSMNTPKIIVCMGSSCFARGNRENLKIIKDFLSEHKLSDRIKVEGILCSGDCGKGPNICFNSVWYRDITQSMLRDVLEKMIRVD